MLNTTCLLKNLGKNLCSFLIYPGKILPKNGHFEQISVFVWRERCAVVLVKKNFDFKFVSSYIVEGDKYNDCSNVYPSDSLNLFHGS